MKQLTVKEIKKLSRERKRKRKSFPSSSYVVTAHEVKIIHTRKTLNHGGRRGRLTDGVVHPVYVRMVEVHSPTE